MKKNKRTIILLSAITGITVTVLSGTIGISVAGLTPLATGVVASVIAIAVLTLKFNKIAKKKNDKEGE